MTITYGNLDTAPAPALPVVTTAPVLAGGQPNVARPIDVTPPVFANATAVGYLWQRSADGQSWDDIPGATVPGYTPAAGDLGRFLSLLATGSNIIGRRRVRSNILGPVLPEAAKLAFGSRAGPNRASSFHLDAPDPHPDRVVVVVHHRVHYASTGAVPSSGMVIGGVQAVKVLSATSGQPAGAIVQDIYVAKVPTGTSLPVSFAPELGEAALNLSYVTRSKKTAAQLAADAVAVVAPAGQSTVTMKPVGSGLLLAGAGVLNGNDLSMMGVGTIVYDGDANTREWVVSGFTAERVTDPSITVGTFASNYAAFALLLRP